MLDISQLDAQTAEEFLDCRHNRNVLAMLAASDSQQQIAQDLHAQGLAERKSMDGLGAAVAEIDATAWHAWGQRFSYDEQGRKVHDGYACWRDKQFMHEFLRDNPAARIRARGTKTQVGFTAPSSRPADFTGMTEVRQSKFRKHYD